MNNLTTDHLREEVRAAVELRDKHLSRTEDLVKRYCGRYWRADVQPDNAMVVNHAYEFIGILAPSLVYDSPRCKIDPLSPSVADIYGALTMKDVAFSIETILNRTSEINEWSNPLFDAVIDYFFAWSVLMVDAEDLPGQQGAELMRRRPIMQHLQLEHFVMDPAATNHDPTRTGGPCWMGHMWKAKIEDLRNDPSFDQDEVMRLREDDDLTKYDPERERGLNIPKRHEVLAYDIWVRDEQLTDEPGYHGAIYTLAMANTAEGVGKKSYWIRPPRPAFCGPWGKYVVSGAYKVRRSPFPLSPLAATAEQAEAANAFEAQAAYDARNYKHFVVGQTDNPADGNRVRDVQHGQYVGLDDPNSVKEIEMGGVSDAQYRFNEHTRERLNEMSGLSDAMRGNVDGDGTATEQSIAQSNSDVRVSGMKRAFRRGVKRAFEMAAWQVYYDEGQIHDLGEAGRAIDVDRYFGGVIDTGRESWDFHTLALSIDPLSMEHTDQALYQRRLQSAFSLLAGNAPTMSQTPWIRWAEPIKTMFDALNIHDADDWFDAQALQQVQQMQFGIGGAPAGAPTDDPSSVDAGGSSQLYRPYLNQARESAGEVGQVMANV